MTRMTRIDPTIVTLVAALALLSFGTAEAAPQRLAAPTAGDLHAPAAIASPAPSQAQATGPASFTWPIDQAADDLDERPIAHTAQSTGHAVTVTAAALRAGLPLPISRPGAFIKISPQSGTATAISVLAPDGRQHTIGAGLRRIGSADGGAFTLDPALGTGVFMLRLTASTDVRIDVLERDSDVVFLAQAASDVVFVGDELQVEARLLHRGKPVPADRVTATLHAPDGRTLARTLTRARDGSYRARLPVRGSSGPAGQPWKVELQADARVDGRPVRRSTTTAVAVSVPTARPTGAIELTRPREAVRAELELDVASPGRYAVTAVLYGRNRDGQLQPIAVGQAADDLEPGRRILALEFDAATVTASGLRGPFELRDLRLVDQGRMFVLHRQAR